ncbi:MAG TPA: aromatic-ring-hydroxylating dioxygenase subunit beta [Alphaproteobacteria bacterium]|nr:aromatic-ring-hydroxylating dioxygenase subunit beta [Alphaproteobacteria bacterium]
MTDAAALLRAVDAFLYREARLLDAGAFEDWRGLFAEDGVYWIPSEPGQSDPVTTVSILREDKALLAMRVRRLGHPRAFALEPRPRTVHSVTNVEMIDLSDANGLCHVASALTVHEYRAGDRAVRAARCEHRLRPAGDSFRIVLKRVDLIDCDAVHDTVISIPL